MSRALQCVLVIGLGSGRSGTQSLANLLNNWPHVSVTHESFGLHDGVMRWDAPGDARAREADKALTRLCERKGDVVGDVWSAHLPYALDYMRWADAHAVSIRFVVTERECIKVARSFQTMMEGEKKNNLQTGKRPRNVYDVAFPKYSGDVSIHSAFFAYCEAYYAVTHTLQRIYPHLFRHFHLLELHSNTNDTTRQALRQFLNISVATRS